MRSRAGVLLVALLAVACAPDEAPPTDTPTFDVDTTRVTVSGLSSGAMMAAQIHVAHSALVGGVALIAGGPYYCAEASLQKGLGPCINGGDVGLANILEYTRAAADRKAIDDLNNLADDRVWLFLGSNDGVMHADTTAAAHDFYRDIAALTPIVVTDVDAPHGFPTAGAGAACTTMAEPWIYACEYDAAGELLATLHGELEPRGEASGTLIEIPQPGAAHATMLPSALAYVPAACGEGESCGVHIAFHGCQQSTDFVGDAFANTAGYNEWAETNRLIVLYPQVASSKIAPLNPLGCWDWWGYTDANYATKSGAQIGVVKATLDLLAGATL